jgi:hypothetical protein
VPQTHQQHTQRPFERRQVTLAERLAAEENAVEERQAQRQHEQKGNEREAPSRRRIGALGQRLEFSGASRRGFHVCLSDRV